MSNWRDRIKAAVEKSAAKQMRENDPLRETKKYGKPEQETVKACFEWFKRNNFFMHIVDSSATFNPKAGTYISGKAAAGFPDSVGCTPDGTASFVEFKAKGKIATLSQKQYQFLKEAIKRGAFACVVDSSDDLAFKWQEFKDGKDLKKHLPYKAKWDQDISFK